MRKEVAAVIKVLMNAQLFPHNFTLKQLLVSQCSLVLRQNRTAITMIYVYISDITCSNSFIVLMYDSVD